VVRRKQGPTRAAQPGVTSAATLPGHVRRAAVAAVTVLAGLSSGCQPAPQAITMPVSSWPAYEYFYLAEQKGLADSEGLALRSVEYADPQTIVHAFLRGELPVAQLTTVEAVDICWRAPERCPLVVLVLDESRGGDQLLARPGLNSIPQLRGRRVAVTQSTLGPYVLSRALERSGLSLDDVQLTTMPLTAMPAALASGAIDAAAMFPPYSEQARAQAGAKPLFDSREIPAEIFDILVVDPQAYRQLGPALPKLLRVWQAAHTLRQRQPEAAIPLMARREGLTPEAFQQAEQGLVYFNLLQQRAMLAPGGVLSRNLRAVQQVQVQLGLVKPGSPLPSVSDAPLKAALQ